MIKTFVHIIRTYVIGFQYLSHKTVRLVWNTIRLALLAYMVFFFVGLFF